MLRMAKGPLNSRIIIGLCNNNHSEVRMRAIELVDRISRSIAIKLLNVLSNDSDPLVRTSVMEKAVELLNNNNAILHSIFVRGMKDADANVRSYAALGLGESHQIAGLNQLHKSLIIERSGSVKLSIYYSLYILGQNEYIQYVIKYLQSRRYTNRCAAANLLKDVHDADRAIVIMALKSRLQVENTIAVKSSINNALTQLSKHPFVNT